MHANSSFCPYIGLQPYNEEYLDYFYGRARDQRVISSNLLAARLTILYGASGVGKSSVLMAGVVPHLKGKPRIAVVVFRDWHGDDFLAQLKSECIKAIGSIPPSQPDLDLPLDELLYKAGQASTFLIILDQFEEYFLYHASDSAHALSFERELACAINSPEVDANFLITLREDGLSKLDRFRTRIPNLMGNLLRLQHLDISAAEEAIRKPLEVYKNSIAKPRTPVGIEDDLVHAILNQVQSGRVTLSGAAGVGETRSDEVNVRIETPFLQLVMTRLWEEEVKAGSEILRLKTLEDLGGAQNIVCRYLDEVMETLAPLDQELCASFFDRLITPSGTKIACRLDDLTNWAGENKDHVSAVVKVLDDKRLLRTIAAPADQLGAPPGYEIFHDVLAPAVLDWRRRFVERQMQARIRQEEEDKRIKQQEEQRSAERARSGRRAVLVLTLFMIFFSLFAVYSFYQWTKAEELRQLAQQNLIKAKQSQQLAQQRLVKMRGALKLVKAAMSDDPYTQIEELAAQDASLLNREIQFRVTFKSLGYTNNNGKEVYRFKIFPIASSIPGGQKTLASITYRTPHPTFKKQMYTAGSENNFTLSYIGWGVINVIAIIEYADPDEAPSLAIINMYREQTPE